MHISTTLWRSLEHHHDNCKVGRSCSTCTSTVLSHDQSWSGILSSVVPRKATFFIKRSFFPGEKVLAQPQQCNFCKVPLKEQEDTRTHQCFPNSQESFHTEEAPSAVHGESMLQPCVSQARSAKSEEKHLKQPGKNCPVPWDGV